MNVRVDANLQGNARTAVALLFRQIGQEFGNRRHLGQTLLHQLPMVGIEGQVGFVKVARVSPEVGSALRDHRSTGTSVEVGQISTTHVGLRDVLR